MVYIRFLFFFFFERLLKSGNKWNHTATIPLSPYVFSSVQRFSYDFSKPLPPKTELGVKLQLRVSLLNLTDSEKHKFLLLAGDSYDPYEDIVCLVSSSEHELEVKSYEEQKLELVERMERILNEAKVNSLFMTIFMMVVTFNSFYYIYLRISKQSHSQIYRWI